MNTKSSFESLTGQFSEEDRPGSSEMQKGEHENAYKTGDLGHLSIMKPSKEPVRYPQMASII